MKLLHLSDLHIGKRINGFSMMEDQEYILSEIIGIIDEIKPQGVVIAGDIYDKPVPPADAVQLFDSFLARLCQRNISIFAISGNHDSAERIAFGSKIMKNSHVYMSPVFEGTIEPISLSDEFGEINIYLCPFIKPSQVKKHYAEEQIETYNDAVKAIIKNLKIHREQRNILVAHQFVTGAERCESEELWVGGLDNVDGGIFNDFDYVALGHIHKPQKIIKDSVRYAGTPLKYSFSEVNHKKSVTVVELMEKGNTVINTIPLIPKHDMREIKGSYLDVVKRENYQGTAVEDYLHVTLTDEEDIPDVINRLRTIYPNIMKLDYDNKRTRSNNVIYGAEQASEKSHLEIFEEFYKSQNNADMSEEQRIFILKMIEEIWEEEE